MPFGQQAMPGQPEAKPTRMTWTGTEERARKLADWGRDEALLPLVAVTPPTRGAAEGTPESEWRVRARVALPREDGGGEHWVDVPRGAVIRNTNTGPTAWVDPALEVVTSAASAATFTKE